MIERPAFPNAMKKASILLLLAVAAFAIISLQSGASYLDDDFLDGLPLGNALTALGLCAIAGTAVALSKPGTALRIASSAALIMAATWLPISVLMAGNAALSFSNGRGDAWMVFTLTVGLTVSTVLIWASVAALFGLRKRGR